MASWRDFFTGGGESRAFPSFRAFSLARSL
jgi:hypothetical protein